MTSDVDKRLQSEISNLLRYVERLREEVAGVAHRKDDQTAFESMSDQLDAIVVATREATDTILDAVEGISEDTDKLRAESDPKKHDELCNQITEKTMRAMEACGFQDLTGQRVTKIVRSIKFLEERVEAMAQLWGPSEIQKAGDRIAQRKAPKDGEISLEGPQLPGEAVSQEDIDKFFS